MAFQGRVLSDVGTGTGQRNELCGLQKARSMSTAHALGQGLKGLSELRAVPRCQLAKSRTPGLQPQHMASTNSQWVREHPAPDKRLVNVTAASEALNREARHTGLPTCGPVTIGYPFKPPSLQQFVMQQ